MSSSGIVRIGIWVTDPRRPSKMPARSSRVARSRVHVAGIAAPARQLLPGGRHLAERLAVAGEVRQHDEHMQAGLEGEELRLCQGHSRGEEPLDAGVAGLVEKEDAALHRAARPKAVEKAARLPSRDAHAREDYGERLVPWRPGSLHDSCGQLEPGSPGPEKTGSF